MFIYCLGALILVILFISFLAWVLKYETFDLTRITGAAKHIRLNRYNRIDSITLKEPHPKTGETYCSRVICPSWIPDNAICWKCD